jgi:hypothetical protein
MKCIFIAENKIFVATGDSKNNNNNDADLQISNPTHLQMSL